MANTNRVQLVRSKPLMKLKEKYLSPKGKKLLALTANLKPKERKAQTKEIWAKYGKNRYVRDPESVVIKVIKHEE